MPSNHKPERHLDPAPGSCLSPQLFRQTRQVSAVRPAEVRNSLLQNASQNPDRYDAITQVFDALDELEPFVIQTRKMQDAEPVFVCKETI